MTVNERPAIEFRPMAEADLHLLQEWLRRPHLQQWWREGELSLAKLREKYLPRIRGADLAHPYITWLGNAPVGYIQYYLAAEGSSDWWPDEPGAGVVGIDQFLADASMLGRGLGTEMVSQFVAFLMEDPDVVEIRVDPRPENLRAIQCYTNVGFRTVGPITTPDGPALMMRLLR